MNGFKTWWNLYKFRFVPWIILNLKNKKTVRIADSFANDKIISNRKALKQAKNIFNSLHNFQSNQKFHNLSNHLLENLGFCVSLKTSKIKGAGQGVFIDRGFVKQGTVVAFYPDGNNKGLSKVIYKSCAGRDKIGQYNCCDETWLRSGSERNPLNIGQFVNNHTHDCQANVCYQELEVPNNIKLEYRNYLPNVYFKPSALSSIRAVVLIATKEINEGEELLSSYYNIIKGG